MNPAYLPDRPVDQVAVFVGTSAGATSFPPVAGVAAHTLWGYLALQLGGEAAYGSVERDDTALTAVGAAEIKAIIGDRPTIILIDEIARYLATAAGQPVGDTTLARQTVSFLMALMEAVDAVPHAALVITSTEVTDAFGDETQAVLDAVTEARSLMARREHVIRPSDEADLPKILARRLFEHFDPSIGEQIGREYAAAAADAFSRGTDLPEPMQSGAWADEVARNFPFHPALIRVLDKRLSTIPNFQRTRGALRLLARTVRLVWEHRQPGVKLLHPHHLDLSDRATAEDLSSRLDLATFEPVIRADVASQAGGEPSHAEEVDHRLGIPYARRLATTAYLYSLTREIAGAPRGELVGAVLAPGDDPNVIVKALDAFAHSAWYLHEDERGYRFSTDPSLVKLIQDAMSRIGVGKVRNEATAILARQYRDNALKVRRSWEDARVPDRDDEANLVILHWDEFGDARGVDPSGPVPARVQELWERTPAGGLREYRNRLVFLVPGIGTHDDMLAAVRRHLALTQLAGDSETLKKLSEERRAELKRMAKESELLAAIAVCNHVSVLYVPQAGGLEAVELPTVTQASAKANQSDAILERLAAMDKTLAAGDKPIDPAMVWAKLGALLEQPQPTTVLVRAFAQRSDLKLVLDRNQLVSLVGAGVRAGVWEYHDATRGEQDGWATKERSTAGFRIADDTFLYPPGSAPAAPEAPCPFCGSVHTGACPTGPGPGPGPISDMFTEEGAASVAVGAVRQTAMEAGRTEVRAVTVRVHELGADTGTQLARLLSLVPASTTGVSLEYRIDLKVTLDEPAHSLGVQFTGTPAEYQPVKAAVDQVLRTRQASLTASLHATFDPAIALGGDEYEQLVQRARDTGPAKCTVELSTGVETE